MQAQQVLHKLLMNTCPGMHQTRRESLQANVMAALTGTRLTVTDLGRSIQSSAGQKHCIKRSDRLLSNRHLHRERGSIYADLARLFVGSRTRPMIIMDWSDLDKYKQHFLLWASLAVDGRPVTLYEAVHTLKTREKPRTHLNFLQQLKAMLPASCCPIIISDAGFRVPWFKQVGSFDWDWIGRVRHRTYVQWQADAVDDQASWFPGKTLYTQATLRPKVLGAARLVRNNPVDCQLIVFQAKPKGRVHLNRLGHKAITSRSHKQTAAAKEPWLLATSLAATSQLAKRIVKAYAQRMQIEESCRDMKSTRLGLSLELHLTWQIERLQVMLLMAHLALLVAWLLGKATELTGQHRQYQANTVRDRKVLSTLFIGLKMMNDRRVILTALDLIKAWQQLHDSIQAHCLFDDIKTMRKAT